MRRMLSIAALLPSLGLATLAAPCTIVMVHDAETVLVGNNEDATDLDTRMWFVPASGDEHGRVCFGASTQYTQGGMNDQGLFIDGNHVHAKDWQRDPAKADFEGRNVIDEILARCATVGEAAAFFRTHNTPSLAHAKFPIADAQGGAIIVEWGAGALQIHHRSGPYLVATNFVQADQPAGAEPCDRYRIAHTLLEAAPTVSVDAVRAMLSATHQELKYPTLYSNIYDLKQRKVYLYSYHDFERAVEIDLAAELARGAAVVEIPSLFPVRPYAALEFRRSRPEPGAEVLLDVLDAHGIDAAVRRFHELKLDFTPAYRVEVGEAEINRLGYRLLAAGRHDEAIAMLALNAAEHPESGNAHDSLGEAYAARGDVEAALASYRRSLELDPANANAERCIAELVARR